MTSAPAIAFEYRSSARLRRLGLGIAALAVVAIGLSALPLWTKPVLAVAVLVATWRTQTRMLHSPTLAVGWDTEGQWMLHCAGAATVAASLVSFRILGDWVLLRFTVRGGRSQCLVLAADNSDAGLRRRLRMRLATVQPGEALPRI